MPPARIVGLAWNGGNAVLQCLGTPGGTYGVQYATDVASPSGWHEFSPAATFLAPDNGSFSYTDHNPADPVRFYHVILRP